MDDFERKLATHLEEQYQAETIYDLKRICHVGRVSCETLIDILSSVETDPKLKDYKMLRQAEENFDRTFIK